MMDFLRGKFRWAGPIAALAISVLSFTGSVSAQNGGRLVFAATGGQYEQILRKYVFEPFSRDTGIDVVFVSGTLGERWGKLKAMAAAGQVEWDMMESGSGDVWIADRRDLLLDLGPDCARVPKAKADGLPDTCNRYGVLPAFGATLLIANADMFAGKPPTTWRDFFDIKSFPGPRALSNTGDPWRVLVGALLADGVPADKLFPLDLDRAFRKLDEIRPEITLWWRSGDQIQRAIRDQEVAATLIWNSRAEFLRKEGIPVKRIWDGATLNLAYWSVFKGAPDQDNAVRFLNWYLDHPEVQVAFGRAAAAAPATKSALTLYSPDEQKDQPTDPDNAKRIVPVDYDWLGRNTDEIVNRWNAWLSR